MVRFIPIVIILINLVYAESNEIKTDNTVVLTLDDFSQGITYPQVSTNKNAVSLIIKNRAKLSALFALRKNNILLKFISVPSMNGFSETIQVNNADTIILRPMSPPQNDVKVYPYSNVPNKL